MAFFKQVTLEMQSYIVPMFFRDVMKGISDRFSKDLMRYVPEFEGVLVAYNDIQLLENSAALQSETDGSVWVRFRIRLSIWAPARGDVVRGKIIQKGHDYLAVLIYDTWNASIPFSEFPVGFDLSTELLDDTSAIVQFVVKHVDVDERTVTIAGTLKPKNCGFILPGENKVTPVAAYTRAGYSTTPKIQVEDIKAVPEITPENTPDKKPSKKRKENPTTPDVISSSKKPKNKENGGENSTPSKQAPKKPSTPKATPKDKKK